MLQPSSDREQLALSMRALLRQLFVDTLEQAAVEKAFARHVNLERGILRVSEDLFDLRAYARTFVVSMGKAGHSMAEALGKQAGERWEGIVASPLDPGYQLRGFRYFRGGHPTPNRESVAAAEAILKSLTAQNASSLVIFMISGGGSSVVEKAMDDQISLEDLVATYQTLIHSGAAIAQINAIRKHLSAVKGGRLARVAYPAEQVSLLISDVPEATLDALASGPTMPDSTTSEDCYSIANRYDMLVRFPASIRELFERQALDETPKSDDPVFHRCRWWPILSNATAVDLAVDEAKRLGFAAEIDNGCDDWEYDRAATYLLDRLRQSRKMAQRVCLVSGGEVTVEVRNGGVGGRNQQLVLALAERIAGENISVLSAGTDGIDGNSPAAGAVADGTTMKRAASRGLSAQEALKHFDAYSFFHSLGDAIITGATGNNLRDLRILLAY